MSAPRLFVRTDPDTPDHARLASDGAAHLRALRLDVGGTFEAILGPGKVRRATIEKITRRGAELRLGSNVDPGPGDPTHPLHLLLALADLSRFDGVIEKATELGATHVLPFRAARSQVSRLTKSRLERWERIARSACEQCGRTTPPELGTEASLEDRIAALPAGTRVVAFSPESERRWAAGDAGHAPLALVIGPEGGLTPGEIAWLEARGANLRHLGPRVLRFETAAIAALTLAAAGFAESHLE